VYANSLVRKRLGYEFSALSKYIHVTVPGVHLHVAADLSLWTLLFSYPLEPTIRLNMCHDHSAVVANVQLYRYPMGPGTPAIEASKPAPLGVTAAAVAFEQRNADVLSVVTLIMQVLMGATHPQATHALAATSHAIQELAPAHVVTTPSTQGLASHVVVLHSAGWGTLGMLAPDAASVLMLVELLLHMDRCALLPLSAVLKSCSMCLWPQFSRVPDDPPRLFLKASGVPFWRRCSAREA
jgi:hypothetical protein